MLVPTKEKFVKRKVTLARGGVAFCVWGHRAVVSETVNSRKKRSADRRTERTNSQGFESLDQGFCSREPLEERRIV